MDNPQPLFLYIVSGGTGASGEQLVHTVLVQFPQNKVQVVTIPHVRQQAQIEAAVAQAANTGGIIVHTMVEERLRAMLSAEAQRAGVEAIDLMGDLLARLSARLSCAPLGQPGLYRRLNQAYFERVSAIDYTMAHDDGKHPEGWGQAEIVLAGVSRAGKTPLSMYLAVLGWKVANVPLVPEIPTPPELFKVDPQRVMGLLISPDQLIMHRQKRRREMGAPGLEGYTNYETIREEIEAARRIFRRGGFSVIDVNDKPIESSANEIIELITSRFGAKARM